MSSERSNMLTPENVFLALKPVDMRRGIDTLTQYVQDELKSSCGVARWLLMVIKPMKHWQSTLRGSRWLDAGPTPGVASPICIKRIKIRVRRWRSDRSPGCTGWKRGSSIARQKRSTSGNNVTPGPLSTNCGCGWNSIKMPARKALRWVRL